MACEPGDLLIIPSTVSAIAWSSADEMATACYGRVTFFDATTGELRQQLEWTGSLVSMVLSPDRNVVACGSQDNSVHFWRRSTEQDAMMSGYPAKPAALAFDDTGTLLATGGGAEVTVWSFGGKGPEGTRPSVLEFHDEPVATLAFAPGVRRLASGGAMAPSLCGRYRKMEKANRLGLRIWRAQSPRCTGDQMGARSRRSTRRVS